MSENRIAVAAVIVETKDSIDELNAVLHEYGELYYWKNGYSKYFKRCFCN